MVPTSRPPPLSPGSATDKMQREAKYISDTLYIPFMCFITTRILNLNQLIFRSFIFKLESFLLKVIYINLIKIQIRHVKIYYGNGFTSKRQQPDHRADNYRRTPIGLQRSKKLPHLEVVLSKPLNKIKL